MGNGTGVFPISKQQEELVAAGDTAHLSKRRNSIIIRTEKKERVVEVKFGGEKDRVRPQKAL